MVMLSVFLGLFGVTASMPSFSWMNVSDPPDVRAAKVNADSQTILVQLYTQSPNYYTNVSGLHDVSDKLFSRYSY